MQTFTVHVCAGPEPSIQGKHALNPRNKAWLHCVINLSLVGTESGWCFGFGTETWSTGITIKRCLSYLKPLPAALPVALKRRLCFTNILQQFLLLTPPEFAWEKQWQETKIRGFCAHTWRDHCNCVAGEKELTESDPANSHGQNPGTTHQTRVSEGAETALQVIKWH